MPSEKRARQRALRDQKLATVERRRKRRRSLRRALSAGVVAAFVILLVVLLSSHSNTKKAANTTTTTTTTLAPTTTQAALEPTCPPAAGSATREIAFKKPPTMCISTSATYQATVKTDVGTFVMKMPAAASPAAVNNFVFLARYHFYDGTIFHRVIPGFVVQGGDPTGTGTGGPGYSFTGNTPKTTCQPNCYALGAVAMANTGGSPSTDGSQFFVVVGSQGEQLPPDYTDFAQVTSGMAVVQKIAADGNSSPSANGVPPRVTHHIVSVTISNLP